MTISKSFLVAVICFGVLVLAFGVYGYLLYSEVSRLGCQVDDLQREINLLKSSKTFNFFWQGSNAEKFNVTTFWMNITFERANETFLFITVKTNHLIFGNYHVGIVFDTNHNGEIDECGKMYRVDNSTYERACFGPYRDGERFLETIASSVSFNTHTCTFHPQLGFTYVMPIDLQDLNLTNDLIHVEYQFTYYG